MSTTNESVIGKARSAGTNFWLTALAISILVFAVNTALSVWRATRLSGATTAVADLQVLSQQLASQAQEATAGNAEAFNALKATKEQIDRNIALVDAGYGNDFSVSAPISRQ